MSDRKRDRGAAAVEFALVLPLLVMLVFGIAELGRIYHAQTTIAQAARVGVRVMALQDDPAAARTATRQAAEPLAVTAGQVGVNPGRCSGSAGSVPGTATVTVTYPMELLGGFLGSSITLTGRGAMRCHG